MRNKKMSSSLQLLLLILQNSKDINDMTEMKVYKLLYFLEKVYFENFGKSFVGEVMTRNTHGPVTQKLKFDDNFNDFVKLVSKDNLSYYSLKNNDFSIDITERERDVLREGLERYKRLSAVELRTLSHKEAPYLMAEKGAKIDISNVVYNDILEDEEDKKNIINLDLSKDESNNFLLNLKKVYG